LARSRHATSSPYAVNGNSFYHADGNGNVTYLASSSDGTDAAYRYDPFGRWWAQTGPYASANVMRFSSKPWVAHNGSNTDGLYYYGYRFYGPLTQRWPNRDPIGERGGLNLYGFVVNNPLTRFDALGLQWPGYPDWPQKPPPPKPPKYPKGFALCQRNIQKDGSCDCPAIFANAIGGEHAYMQYVDDEGNKWGYGFGEPGTAPEKHFDPNSCKPCKKTGGTLKHGSGSGKAGSGATDDEIKDCIKYHPPSKDYKAWGKNRYNCKDWAEEAAANCGLDCN
jgi:RHS repeat-associated protein